MDEFLAAGGVIVANRYATSSMAHQAAKCKTEKEQNEFLKWIYELEYKV
ncbi:thymidylate kinase, partial [Candidatus Roizmanbacteria bacterium CG17_big_fil_post_rev_8_21_14_2_50_39_7]